MKGKRILLCCNRAMNIGGIEKALTTLLAEFNTTENEVVLVINSASGAFYEELPTENIQMFCTNTINPTQYLKDDIKHLRLGKVISGLWHRLMLRLDRGWYAQLMHTYHINKRGMIFPGHFDCAIAYSTDYADMAMVVNADADKRVAFVHGDATYYPRPAKLNDKLVCGMDMIYSVSYEARDKFLQMHPGYKGQTDIIHNVVIKEDILNKAQAEPADMCIDGVLTLCTVARMVPEKGQYMIPGIAARLCRDGLRLRWYLVGDGSDRERVEKEIRTYGMEDCVILLGRRSNPYPYMKNCDLYVQTSFHEAYCLAVAEARVLHRPIVTTNATGVSEQFNGGDGLVVSQTADALYEGIRKLLEDEELRRSYSQKLAQTPMFEEDDLPKLYQYIME